MFISMAYAQETTAETTTDAGTVVPAAPSTANAFAWNIGVILILVIMFYVLLIRPQQKRFTEHRAMLDSLKKGDAIVTSGGLVGKIDKMQGDDEVIIDLGNGVKVTALRHTIQTKVEKDAKKESKK
jgi:preprotein translocase subunit YajC